MPDFEKLGVFYLGKSYDAAKKRRRDDLLLYDSRDLVTHAIEPATEKLETLTLRPKKSDVTVRKVALLWRPFRGGEPAFG
jgi:hypothetical protein